MYVKGRVMVRRWGIILASTRCGVLLLMRQVSGRISGVYNHCACQGCLSAISLNVLVLLVYIKLAL